MTNITDNDIGGMVTDLALAGTLLAWMRDFAVVSDNDCRVVARIERVVQRALERATAMTDADSSCWQESGWRGARDILADLGQPWHGPCGGCA